MGLSDPDELDGFKRFRVLSSSPYSILFSPSFPFPPLSSHFLFAQTKLKADIAVEIRSSFEKRQSASDKLTAPSGVVSFVP